MRKRRSFADIVDPDRIDRVRVLEGQTKVRSVIMNEEPNNLLEVSDHAFNNWAKDVEAEADRAAEEARKTK